MSTQEHHNRVIRYHDISDSDWKLFGDEIQKMLVEGIPLTRDNFIDRMGFDELPDPWTAEHELRLPECFRLAV